MLSPIGHHLAKSKFKAWKPSLKTPRKDTIRPRKRGTFLLPSTAQTAMELTTHFHVYQYTEGKLWLLHQSRQTEQLPNGFLSSSRTEALRKITLESGFSTCSGWRVFLKSDTSELLACWVAQTPST